MSWSINLTSNDRAALATAIDGDANCPQELRNLLCQQVAVAPLADGEALVVTSNGHRDSFTCYGDFKVQRTRLVVPTEVKA